MDKNKIYCRNICVNSKAKTVMQNIDYVYLSMYIQLKRSKLPQK